jgi:hypothetical protein
MQNRTHRRALLQHQREDEETLAPEHEGESEMRDAASSTVIEDRSM